MIGAFWPESMRQSLGRRREDARYAACLGHIWKWVRPWEAVHRRNDETVIVCKNCLLRPRARDFAEARAAADHRLRVLGEPRPICKIGPDPQ